MLSLPASNSHMETSGLLDYKPSLESRLWAWAGTHAGGGLPPTKTFYCGWSVLKCYSSAMELVGINPEWLILELYFGLLIISQVSSGEKQIVLLLNECFSQ